MNGERIFGDTPETTIVVTGMGAVSGAGGDVESLWRAAVSRRSPAALFCDPNLKDNPTIPACAVQDEHLKEFPLKRYRRLDRSVHLAVNAAAQARDKARLTTDSFSKDLLGVVVGTSRGPIHTTSEAMLRQIAGKQVAPCSSAHTTIACASGAVAFALGAAGPNQTVSATCASGAHAIISAAQQLLLGGATHVIAGGTDAPLHDAVIRQMAATGVLGSHDDPRLACRPFDRDRNGTILGEGAAFVVLETLASAQKRGAVIHAIFAGWATGTDCHHETAPSGAGESLVTVMQQALRMARVRPTDLGAINLHGTGTVLNDATEAAAVRSVLGKDVARVPCSSTKPITGHCLGAAAALEAVLAIMMLKHQCVPPISGCQHPDADCDLDLVLGEARVAPIRAVMSNSVGFWGNNAALVFTSPE